VDRDIGSLVRARGARAWDPRAVVGTPRKLWFVATAAGRAARARLFEQGARGEPRAADLWVTPDLAGQD
jgi:hypothetical protein